jgi:peptide/nickel transport system ATP-binding protein
MLRAMGEPLLDVRDLRIHFPTGDGVVRAVDGLSFTLDRGRVLGIVGESGSGKSTTGLGVLGLHDRRAARVSGEIWLDGRELVSAAPDTVRRLRGRTMAMVFQDPLSALHPYYPVGAQIVEAYRVHHRVTRAAARARAVDLLGRVGIPRPARRADDYPHQFSGGMRQRVLIAIALSCDPELLIADEPTTALDVTVQAQILDLLDDLRTELNSALIVITHDLGVVAELADEVLVMYAGRGVEHGSARTLFEAPEHPYTWGLLGSMPRLDRPVADRLLPIAGNPPSLIDVPPGCAFHPRCGYEPRTGGLGGTVPPDLAVSSPAHLVRCHLPGGERRRIWAEEIAPRLAAR